MPVTIMMRVITMLESIEEKIGNQTVACDSAMHGGNFGLRERLSRFPKMFGIARSALSFLEYSRVSTVLEASYMDGYMWKPMALSKRLSSLVRLLRNLHLFPFNSPSSLDQRLTTFKREK